MPFLRYLNSNDRNSFTLPDELFSWISSNVTDSINSFKLELYDKFAIVNLEPAYKSRSLIMLLASYIQSVLPLGPDGNPYTFVSFIEELYNYILHIIRDDDEDTTERRPMYLRK